MSTEDERVNLDRLEALLDARLPEDYRDWLVEPNAPYPVPVELWIPDEDPWIDTVELLFTAGGVLAAMTLEVELNAAECRDYPRQMIPIGNNDGGNNYLLSLRTGEFGAVYYMFHETCHPEDDDHEGLYFLAPSFGVWLDSLVKQAASGKIHTDEDEIGQASNPR